MLTTTYAGTDSTLHDIGLPYAQLPNQGRGYLHSDPKPPRLIRWASYVGRCHRGKGRRHCTSYLQSRVLETKGGVSSSSNVVTRYGIQSVPH